MNLHDKSMNVFLKIFLEKGQVRDGISYKIYTYSVSLPFFENSQVIQAPRSIHSNPDYNFMVNWQLQKTTELKLFVLLLKVVRERKKESYLFFVPYQLLFLTGSYK